MEKVYVVYECGCVFQYNENGDYFENVIAVCEDKSLAIEYVKAGYENLMTIYRNLCEEFKDNENVVLTEPFYKIPDMHVSGEDAMGDYLEYKYAEFKIAKEVKLP